MPFNVQKFYFLMFIKDVVMDGFKCYTDRTTIKNIDRSFTAITGLNGSGKSNVIDAIIFALDLSSSKLMRVASLKELINIHRKECTVTLVFNNMDKASSPSGYEHYDVFEVTRSLDPEGKSKFKINNHSCTKGTIEKMCRSIGITSDFIVMQGHITKILNMRNAELRNMIEEAAGTKNYNIEKEKAKDELEKKGNKLREAREYLKKSISPFLNGLLKEKRIYEEARDFEERKRHLVGELEGLESRKRVNDQIVKVEELETVLDEYVRDKSELDGIEDKLREISGRGAEVDLVEIKSKINDERLRIDEIDRLNLEAVLERKKNERAGCCGSGKMRYNRAQLAEKERILSQEVCNGMSMDKINELERLRAEFARAEIEYDQVVGDLFGGAGSDGCGLKEDGSNANDVLLGINSAVEASSRSALLHREKEEKIRVLRGKINYPCLEGVYGTVDENFDLKDEKFREAVFTILGGRSKFVICENDDIASHLLKTSDRKISCIPLNKIVVYGQNRLQTAGICALDAIRYDPRFDKAYKHVFNGFYIFEDKKEACRCCFENKVVCVTLDGMVYDPKGTLTGGKTQFTSEIVRMRDIDRMDGEARSLALQILGEERLAHLVRTRDRLVRYTSLGDQLENMKNKIGLLEKMCDSKIDVKEELRSIREDMIKAAREESERLEEEKHTKKLSREIEEIEASICRNKTVLLEAHSRLEEYQAILHEDEMRNSTRRVSVRMVESLDLRKKHLIKSTVRLSNRIAKLNELIGRDEAGAFCDKENGRNSGEAQGLREDVHAVFGIDPAIFAVSRTCLSGEEAGALEERIGFLRNEISAKRPRTTMDPASFELLEKNVAVIKDLEEKIEKLEQDKVNIIKSIETLSELGTRENKKAFEHINASLQRFFAYFIKNSEIVITPDFEIRVKAGTWKNSLSELSGGQRSLIALCLIFSMLSYRPAPFYIFDEIDAALDLNYTQGIGDIIQKEFKNAQFIVISLKNNMFECANKIFRVFIQDHKSRICQIK